MILVGGVPGRLVPCAGTHGIRPADIVALGGEDSPLLNDIDPGDDTTTLFWVLLEPLPASGTTVADDLGYYALLGAADGTYEQDYRVLSLTAGGTAAASESTITTVVGAAGATADGVTLRAAARFVPGAATGGAVAQGATLRAAARFVAGGASVGGAAVAGGVTLRAAARFVAGGATAQRNVTADGVTLRAAARFNRGGAFTPGVGGALVRSRMHLRIGVGL